MEDNPNSEAKGQRVETREDTHRELFGRLAHFDILVVENRGQGFEDGLWRYYCRAIQTTNSKEKDPRYPSSGYP